MKKIVLFAILFIVCISLAVGAFNEKADVDADIADQVLRIHIRANSNGDEDQTVKYMVKSAVVDYLVPLLVGATDREKAIAIVRSHLSGLSDVAKTVLENNGFYYGAIAEIKKETFPTRQYDELTLPTGEYTALIVNLGAAEGDNWWCVVYPPLCFVGEVTDGKKVVFVSKLKEIIRDFFNKNK